MSNIKKRSKKVEQEQNAQANKTDVSKSTYESVPESGGEENPTYLLSRELAVALNPKRPDFNGSLMIYGLYLLQKQKVGRFSYCPMVNGERGSYASLSQLHEMYPWLSEEGIRTNLWRAAEKSDGEFVVDNDNDGAENGKLHFWISPALIKQFKFAGAKFTRPEAAKGLIGMKKLEIVKFGIVGAALRFNLQYVTNPQRNDKPVVDEVGRIYRPLSATALTIQRKQLDGSVKPPIFPIARETMSKEIGQLKTSGGIIEHPTQKHFFRLPESEETVKVSVIKVASVVTKVAGPVTRVARQSEVSECKYLPDDDLWQISETSYNRTDTNTYRKCISPLSGSLRSTESGQGCGISPNGKRLMKLVADQLSEARQKWITSSSRQDIQLNAFYGFKDYDQFRCIGYDLPYDFIGLEWYSDKPYNRKAEIDHFMEEVELSMKVLQFPFKRTDLNALRKVFEKNPGFGSDDIDSVLSILPAYSMNLGDCPKPKSGHDWWQCARNINSLKQLVRYLPHLIREAYVLTHYDTGHEGCICSVNDETGRLDINYSDMPENLIHVAFRDETKVPVHYTSEEDENGDWVERPVYYAEFVGEPVKEYVRLDSNPVPLCIAT